MGILSRFKDIMSSNINAGLDKMENPEKMIDQTIRNLQKDLADVKNETALVKAEEMRAERKYQEASHNVTAYQNYAIKALQSGNEDDARKFLAEKVKAEELLTTAQQTLECAKVNSERMTALFNKLSADVQTLESKRADLKAKFAAAKAQERINKMMVGVPDGADSVAAFEKYEAKANAAFDKATAMAELNASNDNGMSDLMSKYSNNSSNSSVDAELEKLKASLK